METRRTKSNFDTSVYYFSGLFVLVIVGFWPSYFAKFLAGTADFAFYLHFHATMLILWMAMLIMQPILIRTKRVQLHRFIGKLSYVLFPIVCISTILVIHQTHTVGEVNLGNSLLAQSKNLFIFMAGYGIAIVYRHNIGIHARGMIVTGIALIEPALTRLMLNIFAVLDLFTSSPNFFFYASIPTILLIFSFLVGLMIMERHQKSGRWVFPLTLVFYFTQYVLVIAQIQMSLWEWFSEWFISLPLT
jgi:hypothetical protein